MKRKLLAITLTLAMLAGLFSVASIPTAAGENVQQACVVGATLTALNGEADADKVPAIDTNLLKGKDKLGSSDAEAKTKDIYNDLEIEGGSSHIRMLTDGFCQGVNKELTYKLDADGSFHSQSYTYSKASEADKAKTHAQIIQERSQSYGNLGLSAPCDCGWHHDMTGEGKYIHQAVSNVGELRYVSYLGDGRKATSTKLGWTQIGFDLGKTTDIAKVLIAGAADPAGNDLETLWDLYDKNPAAGTEIPVTSISKNTRLHMVDVYISDTAEDLYDDGSKVVTMDYLDGDISNTGKSLAPLAGIYELDDVTTGRYVGFRIYVAGYNGTSGITSVNGKSGNWGWWDQVRISELGVYAAETEPVRTPVDEMGDLPQNSLIAGKIPSNDVLSQGSLALMTDGLIQGVNQEVRFDLSGEPEDNMRETSKGTFYSAIAPEELVKRYYGEGADTNKTWYIKPDDNGCLGYVTGQRTALYEDSARIYYDMGESKSVESILLASSMEYGTIDLSVKTENYKLTMKECEELLSKLSIDDRLLHTVKVYVGDDPDTLFEGKPALDYTIPNASTTGGEDYSDALRNLWTLPEAVTGQYVGFDFSDCAMGDLVRISELAVYGIGASTEMTNKPYVTLYGDDADLPSSEENLLSKVDVETDFTYCASAGVEIGDPKTILGVANRRALTDGKITSVEDKKVMTGFKEETDKYIYITYNLGTKHEINSLYYAGDGTDGANSVAVYVGNDNCTAIAEKESTTEPNAFYNGGIGEEVVRVTNNRTNSHVCRFDFPQPLTGQYVTFRLKPYIFEGHGYYVWISEFAALGTLSTEDDETMDTTVDNVCITLHESAADSVPMVDENILSKVALDDITYCQDGGADINSGPLVTERKSILADGNICTDAETKLVATANKRGYIYLTYDLGTEYDIKRLYYAGDGNDGADSVAVYVGDYDCTAIAKESTIEPDAFYGRGIGEDENEYKFGANYDGYEAISFDFHRALTGRYVTFRLRTCCNNGTLPNLFNQVWISELAAIGTPVTIHTAGASLRSELLNNSYYVRFGFRMATRDIGYAAGDLDAAINAGNFAREALGQVDTTTHTLGRDVSGYKTAYDEVIVKDFGAVISNKKGIVPSHLTLERCVDSQTKKVPARNLYDVKDDYITFTVGITGIPNGMENRTLYARPYIVYEIDGKEVTLYGDMCATTVNKLADIANAA